MKWLALGVAAFVMLAADLQIGPSPFADRTFNYLRVDSTFQGIPLKTTALVPASIVVLGAREDRQMFVQAANIAFMLGQWSDDVGSSVGKIKQNKTYKPVVLAKDVTKQMLKNFNVILLGRKNRFFKKLNLDLPQENSVLQVVKNGLSPGRDVLFVSDAQAAAYLANKRLYFKSGAYRGFFNFVRLRCLIEKGQLAAGLDLLRDPAGVRGCAKPVLLAVAHKEKLPRGMLKIAKKRNQLVFGKLKKALKQKNKEQAIKIWQKAMRTCYACHQGQDGVPRFREFTPDPQVHGYHQKIVERFNMDCATCHKGQTEIVGY